MGESGMPRDERVRGSKGRYETRLVTRAPTTDSSADAAPGNSARVRLIVAYRPDAPTFGDGLRVGVMVGASVVELATLTPERASIVMRIEDCGDVILGPIRLAASGPVATCAVWEVLWHPEGI